MQLPQLLQRPQNLIGCHGRRWRTLGRCFCCRACGNLFFCLARLRRGVNLRQACQFYKSVLTGECKAAGTPMAVLLHAGNLMVQGVIYCYFRTLLECQSPGLWEDCIVAVIGIAAGTGLTQRLRPPGAEYQRRRLRRQLPYRPWPA